MTIIPRCGLRKEIDMVDQSDKACPECSGPVTETNEGRSFQCRDHGEFINHGPWPDGSQQQDETDPVYDASAHAEASALFAQLKTLLEPHAAAGADDLADARDELLTEIKEWVTAAGYPSSERVTGYLVTLQRTYKDQDADDMLRMLCRIRGITTVAAVEYDHRQQVGADRVKGELAEKLFKLGRDILG